MTDTAVIVEDRCRKLGVRFLYDSPVTGIRFRGRTVTSVLAGGEEVHSGSSRASPAP